MVVNPTASEIMGITSINIYGDNIKAQVIP